MERMMVSVGRPWLMAFGLGFVIGLIAILVSRGTMLFAIVPTLWSWTLIATVAGSNFANTHAWIAYGLAALMQGLFLVLLQYGVRLLVRLNSPWTLVAAVIIQTLLLLIPAGPE
jgi:hypothetical protein